MTSPHRNMVTAWAASSMVPRRCSCNRRFHFIVRGACRGVCPAGAFAPPRNARRRMRAIEHIVSYDSISANPVVAELEPLATVDVEMTTIATEPDAGVEAQQRTEERIVAVVRDLARELSGDRVANAVTPTASLDRDVGLGSLERVELLMRLETELGRELDDHFLLLDTPREIARAARLAPILRHAPPTASVR